MEMKLRTVIFVFRLGTIAKKQSPVLLASNAQTPATTQGTNATSQATVSLAQYSRSNPDSIDALQA